MFCSKTANKDINMKNKHALRLLYRDYDSSFEQLLVKDVSITVHRKKVQSLMTEIYKTMSHVHPLYIWDFMVEKETLNDLYTKGLPSAQ